MSIGPNLLKRGNLVLYKNSPNSKWLVIYFNEDSVTLIPPVVRSFSSLSLDWIDWSDFHSSFIILSGMG